MTSNNVLEFPKHKIVRDGALNHETINKMREKSTQNFADDLTQELTSILLSEFDNFGIDVDNEQFSKDFIFLVTIMSAVIYRSLELEHDFHNFLDSYVQVKEFDGEETLDNPS